MKRTIINPLIKDTVSFLQTSDETKGTLSELELTLMPGGANFLHYHKSFTETFTAIDGVLGLQTGKQKILLQPGESYSVQPGMPHSFFNPGNKEIKFNIQIRPGHKGFENSLRILYGLAEDGLTNKKSVPKSLQHIAVIGSMSDSYMPGFMKLLTPLFAYFTKQAKRNGLEQSLIDKYCS